MKLKIGLPLVQMLLTLVLLRWEDQWDRAAWRVCDMAGPAPAADLLDSINMPAALLRGLWVPRLELPVFWDWAILIAAVGLFWYWVSLNIQSWRHLRAVLMFSRLWLRVGADMLLILAGLLWGLYGAGRVRLAAGTYLHHNLNCFGPFAWLPAGLAACINLTWALALVYFFARDLYFGSRARSTTSSIVFT